MTEVITLTREDLYSLVWQKPMLHAAESLGMSGRGLSKVCERMEIPYPGRGYWRKLEMGQAVEKELLENPSPECDLAHRFIIRPDFERSSYKDDARTQQAKAFEMKEGNAITVPERIAKFHPWVKETVEIIKKGEPDRYGRCYPGHHPNTLDLSCSKETASRAGRILHVLLAELQKRDYKIIIKTYSHYTTSYPTIIGTFICHSGEEVRITLAELSNKIKPDPKKKSTSWWDTREQYTPSGKLILKIEGIYDASFKRTWMDSEAAPLETQLNSFMVSLATSVSYLQAKRIEEAKQKQAELKRKEEQERLRQLKLEEERRITNLKEHVAAWLEAKHIRAFLKEAMESSFEPNDNAMSKEDWHNWAQAYASRLDPLFLPEQTRSLNK